MADEAENAGGGGGEAAAPPQKCPECVPGLPGWMATFSDLVTLLLTFFVLLLSFAKTESAKYEAALGSIRNAFGGNVLVRGEVITPGKSPDDSPSMIESQEPIRPFPIEFLTMEGILDKHEINRHSDEVLKEMKKDLADYDLNTTSTVYQVSEGVKVKIKDQIFFEEGSVEIRDIVIPTFNSVLKLLKERDWFVYVIGHSSRGEKSTQPRVMDALELSSARASEVARYLIREGIRPEKVTTLFYGDTRSNKFESSVSESKATELNRRVEFIIRKRDVIDEGNKVPAQ